MEDSDQDGKKLGKDVTQKEEHGKMKLDGEVWLLGNPQKMEVSWEE